MSSMNMIYVSNAISKYQVMTISIKKKTWPLNLYYFRRKAIMNTIKIFYMALMKENIPIYGVVRIIIIIRLTYVCLQR
jgi:hypothetical protein